MTGGPSYCTSCPILFIIYWRLCYSSATKNSSSVIPSLTVKRFLATTGLSYFILACICLKFFSKAVSNGCIDVFYGFYLLSYYWVWALCSSSIFLWNVDWKTSDSWISRGIYYFLEGWWCCYFFSFSLGNEIFLCLFF